MEISQENGLVPWILSLFTFSLSVKFGKASWIFNMVLNCNNGLGHRLVIIWFLKIKLSPYQFLTMVFVFLK